MAGATDAARSKKISKTHRARGALGLGSISRAAVEGVARFSSHPQSVKAMRILILGGTGFIDPFQVKYALSRGRLIELCSTGPARILSLQDRGTFRAGARADVAILDPECVWTFDVGRSKSRNRNTPFAGYRFSGAAIAR